MIDLLIALGVIAIFAIGLLRALGVMRCGEARTRPRKQTE